MNSKFLYLLIVIFIIFKKVTAVPLSSAKLKSFQLNEVIGSATFPLTGFNGTWISENEIIFLSLENDLKIYNVEKEENRTLVDKDKMGELKPASTTLSPDGKKLLIRYDVKTVFRHSTVAKYKILNLSNSVISNIGEENHLQICRWAPVKSSLVYVKDNDVYHFAEDGQERRLTFDGIPGVIYNGVPDWVYEEEVLSSDGALWFSPDGNKLAIASFNDTLVDKFSYPIYGEPGDENFQYPHEVTIRYPKANTTNPSVKLSLIDLTKTTIEWKTVDINNTLVGDEPILAGVTWSYNYGLVSTWLNRRQNFMWVHYCKFDDLKCRRVGSQEELKGWIDVSQFLCYPEIDRCFYIRTTGNWRNIHSIHIPTSLGDYYSQGKRDVLELIGYSVNKTEIYYAATTETNPEVRHIFKRKDDTNRADAVCLSCKIKSPEGILCDYASAKFSKDFSYFALTCSGPAPSFTRIYKTDTIEEVFKWEENTGSRSLLKEYQEINIKYLRVPVGRKYSAAVKLFLPEEIDVETTKTKYPMIVSVYGGPNSVRVTTSFSIGFQNYLVTNRKVIYCQIDGRGSGNKGQDMLFQINNKMGTVEIEDQITVTKYLQEIYKFIDAERTGIWGWSYGGYATAMALIQDKERVFQCGISVAPVTSWRFYDSIYTERYMGLPIDADNLIGYNNSDVSLQVEGMRNHDYMLIHGSADDNVHYQQAMVLARALQKADILFEQMSYPDEAHALSGVLPHLYMTMDDFWTNCLNIGGDE